MKALKADELRWVAGGLDTITVWGERDSYDYDDFLWDNPDMRPDDDTFGNDWPDDNNGGGNNGFTPDPDSDPNPPAKAPQGVDPQEVRNLVRASADEMKARNAGVAPANQVEYAQAIVQKADGTLVASPISTGTNTSFSLTVSLQPGDQIVAIIHSHPQEAGVDNRMPSDATNAATGGNGDEEIQQDLIDRGKMDPDALIYILDNASGHLYEYAATDKDDSVGYDVTDPSSDAKLPGQ